MTIPGHELLLALQHADSAFPSGGFAFSQGLEAASTLVPKLGPFGFEAYISSQLSHRWASADLVALVRGHRLAGDVHGAVKLDREVEASSLIDALRTGSRRNGMAFLTSHYRIGCPVAKTYSGLVRQGEACGHLAVAQGLVWHELGIGEQTAAVMSGYQTTMLLATAAIRLGVVGVMEAQKVVGRALPLIETLAGTAIADDMPLSSFAPLSEIAMMLHGHSGQQLFSN